MHHLKAMGVCDICRQHDVWHRHCLPNNGIGLFTCAHSLATMIINHRTALKCHINGLNTLSLQAKRFVVHCGIVAYPAEAVLKELLGDDRVLRRLSHLQSVLYDEVEWACSISDHARALLGQMESAPPVERKYSSIHVVHASASYIHVNVFTHTEKLPLSLAVGGIKEHLSAREVAPCPSEPTAKRAWGLPSIKEHTDHIASGVRLFLDAPSSSIRIEQQHLSGKVAHTPQPDYGPDMRATIGTIHTLMPLIQEDAHDKQLAQLEKEIEVLCRKRPAGITARQIYFKEHTSIASEWKVRGRQGLPCKLQSVIMKGHAIGFKQLPQTAKGKLAAQAVVACKRGTGCIRS